MADQNQPRNWRQRRPFYLPADIERRWERPHLKRHLRSDERLLWTDIAATGLLGQPWITGAFPPIGSAFWDVAVTDGRLIAVRLTLGPIFRRKVRSFMFAEMTNVELRFRTMVGSVILSLKTPESKWHLKMFRMALDYAAAERALREVYPEVLITGLPGP